MLTILSWVVFVPAIIWNITLFSVAFGDLFSADPKLAWTNKRNIRDMVISLVLLFAPGVYLFGWF
jgi:hypothetical protein